jgi:hypothetical protein
VQNNPVNFVDPSGLIPIDTIWDVGNVIYDIITGDWEALAIDTTAMFIPYVPAGITKVAKVCKVGKQEIGEAAKASTRAGNPFKGKTPEEIDKMFRNKGFDPKGPDPISGRGGYVNPDTGRSYHIDPGGQWIKGTEAPHIDVNRPSGSGLPKRKFPLE